NIQTVLGTEDNPKLPENSVDACLILKTYHEIAQPVKELENLRPALKKDALVGVIDRNGNGADHGIQMQTVIDEFKRAGYEKVADYDFVKPDGMDYFLVCRAAQ
ncbi:MAG: class I SAM-dependent methyltransferase, partial [Pyrinomonadaceae bacterium]